VSESATTAPDDYRRPPQGRVIAPSAGRQTHDRLLMHCRMKARLIRKNDIDWWTGHTGIEGAGKSTECVWNCAYTDPTFIHDWRNRISYTADQFMEQIDVLVDEGKPARSLMLDEAGEAWLNQEWATQVQRTLTKMSIQIRYANLDIHLVVPTLKLLGSSAVRRLTDLAHVEMHNWERGFVTYYRAYSSPFTRYRVPFWNPLFYHHFYELPTWFYEKYKKYKVKSAQERMAKYIEEAAGGRRSDHADMSEVINHVVTKASRREDIKGGEWTNNRGNVEPLRLLQEYRDELRNFPNARTASILLTRLLRDKRAEKRAKNISGPEGEENEEDSDES
jgi:hypothetical protein